MLKLNFTLIVSCIDSQPWSALLLYLFHLSLRVPLSRDKPFWTLNFVYKYELHRDIKAR